MASLFTTSSFFRVAIVAALILGCDQDVPAKDSAPESVVVQSTQDSTTERTMETESEHSGEQHSHSQDGHQGEPNRLADETSPYLLQHAYNPVNWYPWGEEAFAAARERDVPIFLSIGYSTCYWCHVMERESFENPEVGKLMNRDFVCIKVDREQRPDVDEIYMTACQVFTRITTGRASGGWPLSIFLDPKNLKPFLAGTYFPPQPGFGKPSFMQLLDSVHTAWETKRPAIEEQANQIATLVTRELETQTGVQPLDTSLVNRAVSGLLSFYDETNGGFGGAPKFPQPVYVELMIDGGWDRPDVQQAVKKTLDSMAIGGIYDHVGGGFHRYAVDEDWTVPHFEKMLYDNGQLASLYADVYERTGDEFYAEVVRGILDYVLREMTAPDGAFLSAQDAEVNAREGGSYIWLPEEVKSSLSNNEDDLNMALEVYGLSSGPNFRDPHHPDATPANVLRFQERPEALAKAQGVSREEFMERLSSINSELLKVRDKREQPMTDDKVLAAWNGLMIKGMADGGRVLQDQRYIDAAAKGASAVLARLQQDNDGLLRTSRGDVAQIDAFLEDYALLAEGFIALYRATDDQAWLENAEKLVEAARERFWNDERGGWYDTQADQADLFVRSTNLGDGAVPSGSGTMLLVLLELYELTGNDTYIDDASAAFRSVSANLAQNPTGMSRSTRAVLKASEIAPSALPKVAESPPPSQPVRAALFATADPGNWVVRLTIAPTMHINAHEPGDSDLVGLSIQAVSGGTISVAWPEGELYRDEIRIHKGVIDVPVTVNRDTPESTVVLNVIWQACTDTVCLRAEQTEIKVPPQ